MLISSLDRGYLDPTSVKMKKLDAIGRKRVAKFRVSEARYVRELIREGLDPPRDRNRT